MVEVEIIYLCMYVSIYLFSLSSRSETLFCCVQVGKANVIRGTQDELPLKGFSFSLFKDLCFILLSKGGKRYWAKGPIMKEDFVIKGD